MMASVVTNLNTGVMIDVTRSSSVENLKGHCGRPVKLQPQLAKLTDVAESRDDCETSCHSTCALWCGVM